MRRWVLVVVLVCMIVLLVGCAQVESPVAPARQAATSAPAAPPQELTAADVQRITPAEAKELVDEGAAILYDVRSEGAYLALHAAGAVSFPESGLDTRHGELPIDIALVFY
jgi:hypothetical protein